MPGEAAAAPLSGSQKHNPLTAFAEFTGELVGNWLVNAAFPDNRMVFLNESADVRVDRRGGRSALQNCLVIIELSRLRCHRLNGTVS